MKELTPGDRRFIEAYLLPYFRIHHLKFGITKGTAEYPDIWCDPSKVPPVIMANQTWARQTIPERRKRVVHELLHFIGMQHGRKGKLMYSTYPAKDTFSKAVYLDIVRHQEPIQRGLYNFRRGRFGI